VSDDAVERTPISALGGRHAVHPEVTLALGAMSLLRGVVGFLTFLLAFSLRRAGAPAWWFGLVLAASLAGSVSGVLLVPRIRRLFAEQQMLNIAVWLVAVPATVAAVVGGLAVQAALAFVLGFAAAAAKPAFDALVQHHVPTDEQGRAFARFETRLQLCWVVGALIPVVASLSLGAGDVVIAVMAGVVAVSYASGRRSLAQRDRRRA
jgi:MFS family permease